MTAESKLGREWQRLTRQVGGLRWHVQGALARRRYDAQRAQRVLRQSGAIGWQPEVAVLLIYQPGGVLGSTLATLDWLVGEGVAPIVVSNASLSPSDRDALSSRAHLIIERPNIGYDFGGYREGVMTALERADELAALHVMNDSMWFPVAQPCDVIRRGRQTGADLFGLFLNRASKGAGTEYLQSYYYRFGPRMLADTRFHQLWQSMPLIDDKFMVVRRQERRLTAYFAKRDFRVDALLRWDRVIADLLALEDERLGLYLAYQALRSPGEAARLVKLGFPAQGVARLRPQIDDLVRHRRLFVNLPEVHPALLSDLKVPFLKKGRTPPLVAQRDVIRDLNMGAQMQADVAAEIQLWDSPGAASPQSRASISSLG